MNTLDRYHTHEVLDRCNMLCAISEEWLADHPFMEQHTEIKAKVESAIELLAEAYQMIGAVSIQEDS